MRQFIGTALVATILGIGLGIFLGWEQFPRSPENSSMCQFSRDNLEDYTLMVARGFRVDQAADTSITARDAALERLLPLNANNSTVCENGQSAVQIDNIPAWVQDVTERYRTRGADLRDICDLANLSAAFGRQIPGYADGSPSAICNQFGS
ncbi:MAG: hypothetical protein ACLFTK_02680 [Anaerolineales bacterium]